MIEGNQYVDGNITVGGTITYEDVKNVDSLGIVTARTGVDVLAGGINVVGVSTISTGVGTVHVGVGSTALLVKVMQESLVFLPLVKDQLL